MTPGTGMMLRTAELSECGTYRYSLGRQWEDPARFTLAWVMLNPSTADAEIDDPTIRRCIKYGQAWSFGAITVVNLFALRATDPRELARADDPIGPRNDEAIKRAAADAHWIMLAWGAHPFARKRATEVFEAIRENFGVMCLGTTKDGSPRHPLYVPRTVGPRSWAGYE